MEVNDPTNRGRVEEERVGTVFVVREDEEYCFLYERDNPATLYSTLFDSAEREDVGLTRSEVLEMIEGMAPARLRSI